MCIQLWKRRNGIVRRPVLQPIRARRTEPPLHVRQHGKGCESIPGQPSPCVCTEVRMVQTGRQTAVPVRRSRLQQVDRVDVDVELDALRRCLLEAVAHRWDEPPQRGAACGTRERAVAPAAAKPLHYGRGGRQEPDCRFDLQAGHRLPCGLRHPPFVFRNGFEFILTVDCSVRGHAVRDREVDPPGRAFDLSIYPRVIRPRLATPSVRSSGIRRRSEGMVRDGVPRSRDEQGALSLQDIARDIVQRKIIHGHHSGRRSRRVRDGNPACRGSGDIVLDGRAGVTSPSTVNRLRVALPGRRRVLFSRSVLPTFVVLCVILRAGPATVQGGVERHRTGFSRPAGGDAQGDPAIDPGRDHRVSRWGHDGRT